jgi:hypothetical protein
MNDGPCCPVCGGHPPAQQTHYGVRHQCCGLHSWDGKALVSPETHAARRAAHAAFDALWKERLIGRSEAYKELSKYLHLTPAETHMSLMTQQQAQDTVKFARSFRFRAHHPGAKGGE